MGASSRDPRFLPIYRAALVVVALAHATVAAAAANPNESPSTAPKGRAETGPQEATPPKPNKPSPPPYKIPARHPILIGDLKLLSLGIPTSLNIGIALGVNVTRFAALELAYESGSQNLGLLGAKVGTLRQALYGFQARIFPMAGTFNVLAGYGRRVLQADLDIAGVPLDTDVTVTHRMATLALGNRYYFGPFFFGADWLSVSWTLEEGDVESQLLGQDLEEDAQEDVDKAVKFLDHVPTVTLLNLHVGLGW
jgi:hypothetical protein